MRILFIGDVVGSLGRETLYENLPKLKEKYAPQIIIVNGENSASGKGITEKIYREFLKNGVHAITMGNHVWDNREIFDFIDDAKYLVRPENLPQGTPGKGVQFLKYNQFEIAVVNLIGKTFMNPCEDPFQHADRIIKEVSKRTSYIIVDFHAEATSEKQAMGWYLDGKVSAVLGTHTHIQTADNRILPKGTAMITDVGMTGPYDSVIGMDKDIILKRFTTYLPQKFEVTTIGRAVLSGVIIDINEKTGLANKIERILINDDQPFVF
ncbi:MAG: family metallophosphoesterase [Bacillales bacterium]|jgi:metallophosphoesterase (TIGR00282 family)|nr:family metallophosphoesterase [Bacillales bacterium]